jgi:glycosyltransferase involved in cell wall biosynthesis
MKNILVLDTGKEWGGGVNSLLELLKRIDKSNYKFTALFYHNFQKPGESDIKTEIEKLKVDFILLQRSDQNVAGKILKECGRALLFFSRKLRRLYVFSIDYFFGIRKEAQSIAEHIRNLKIDLLYMNNQPSSNLGGIIAAKKTGVKSVLHNRIEADLNIFEVNATNKSATKIICVSEALKKSVVRQGIKHSKCTVVYNGVDITLSPTLSPASIRQELGIKSDEFIIGSVGSLVKRKRFHDLVKSVAGLGHKNQIPRLKCLIVGDGPEGKELRKNIEKHQLQDKVILTGFQSDALSYINTLDIFVLSSEREGFPRVILEAMLMGKPVIASDVAGNSELIVNGKTGFLFPVGDINSLINALLNLLKTESFRSDFGEAGRTRVIEKFSMDNYINGVKNIFEEVLV